MRRSIFRVTLLALVVTAMAGWIWLLSVGIWWVIVKLQVPTHSMLRIYRSHPERGFAAGGVEQPSHINLSKEQSRSLGLG